MILSVPLSLAVWLLLATDGGSDPSGGWCYHSPSCDESTWTSIANASCGGARQSPINIVTASVEANSNLTLLNFTGFNVSTALTEMKNTGSEVRVLLSHATMAVRGGALLGMYNSRQFYIHWGNGSSVPGSEHAINGKRYPMELHIWNINEKYSSITDALQDPTGIAVLAFFIEASNDTGEPDGWKTLTSHLANISYAGRTVNLTQPITMNSLLVGVNRSRYYRYLGSLTAPNCNEAVVWTVFKDPIRVSHDLVDLFSTTLYISNSTNSSLMTNNFRRIQPLNQRIVTSQVGGSRDGVKSNSITAQPFHKIFILGFLYATYWF